MPPTEQPDASAAECAVEASGVAAAPRSGPEALSQLGLLALLSLVACVAVSAAFWPVLSAGALCFDDSEYVLNNRLVQNPGAESIGTVFSEVLEPSTGGYYKPVSMVLLMLGWELGGRPGDLTAFHALSLVLHVLNTALLIALLYCLFGRPWVAALVGLLFGLHPLGVESVAWVSEQKTVAAAFFSLAALVLYVLYARGRGVWLYFATLGALVLGLLAKPTSTPVPLLLLLLDIWPLRRLSWRAVAEKLPFLALAGASAVVTFLSQARTVGAEVLPQQLSPLQVPLAIGHNIVFYLSKMFWPVALTPQYAPPQPFDLTHPMLLAGVIGTGALMVVLLVLLRWTRAPLVGWLVFFVALLPTTGIVQFTPVIAADRFVYLPVVGLLLVLAWALGAVWEGMGRSAAATVGRTTLVLVLLAVGGAEAWATHRYLDVWHDTERLARHILARDPAVAAAHNQLGWELHRQGRLDEAVAHYERALALLPGWHVAHSNLGMTLVAQNKPEAALVHFREAIRLRPDDFMAHLNLASTLLDPSRPERLAEAATHYRRVLELKPAAPEAHLGLGMAQVMQGRAKEGVDEFRNAIRSNPSYVPAYIALSRTFLMVGDYNRAFETLREVERVAPQDPRVISALEQARRLGQPAPEPAAALVGPPMPPTTQPRQP